MNTYGLTGVVKTKEENLGVLVRQTCSGKPEKRNDEIKRVSLGIFMVCQITLHPPQHETV